MRANLWRAGLRFLRSSESVGMHGSVLLIAGVFLSSLQTRHGLILLKMYFSSLLNI